MKLLFLSLPLFCSCASVTSVEEDDAYADSSDSCYIENADNKVSPSEINVPDEFDKSTVDIVRDRIADRPYTLKSTGNYLDCEIDFGLSEKIVTRICETDNDGDIDFESSDFSNIFIYEPTNDEYPTKTIKIRKQLISDRVEEYERVVEWVQDLGNDESGKEKGKAYHSKIETFLSKNPEGLIEDYWINYSLNNTSDICRRAEYASFEYRRNGDFYRKSEVHNTILTNLCLPETVCEEERNLPWFEYGQSL